MRSFTLLSDRTAQMALKIFVDFDGTVTTHDVGNAFFRTFGGPLTEEVVALYHRGEISAEECYRRECDLSGVIDRAAVDRFLGEQSLDPGFKEFVTFCRERALELTIVSDGLDYYIDRILARHGVEGIPYVANRMELEAVQGESGMRPVLTFPYGDCACRTCAACKRNAMLARAGDDDIIVYVGEGFSDQCPVQYADVVFAKQSLQTFCQRENISYYLYETFHDVTARLRELLARTRVRKRRSAELKRREAFIRE